MHSSNTATNTDVTNERINANFIFSIYVLNIKHKDKPSIPNSVKWAQVRTKFCVKGSPIPRVEKILLSKVTTLPLETLDSEAGFMDCKNIKVIIRTAKNVDIILLIVHFLSIIIVSQPNLYYFI